MKIWPDNVSSVNVFIAMSTQWRVGMNGATGLDYTAMPSVMKFTGVKKKDRSDVFNDVRTMEDAALTQMQKNNSQK